LSTWQRLAPLGGIPGRQTEESWIHTDARGAQRSYPMQVTNGKPFDVLSLKGTRLEEIREYAAFLQNTARKLYGSETRRSRLSHCPCCLADTGQHARETFRFFDVPFHRCGVCGHGFVLERPSDETLNAVFTDSSDHSSTYVDRASLEGRMREIIAPKLQWVLDQYARRSGGGRPGQGVDVGAGGGHFVAAMQRAGLQAAGYELSRASRAFAQEAFGIELRNADFLAASPSPTDLVTFWGLLEYTPEPRRFMEAARRWLSPQGLLIVEVPRLDCVGTAAQATNPYSIARHMDPTSHVNTFSDAGLATALVETGFRPVAAWYFGMDVYELLVQAALRLNDVAAIERLADMIPAVQACLDAGRQCDDIVIAAVPAD
jgi:2-polyprenyl-3-methyl-5-hydroxy-6-metoxy-1,4-benzoquinol methylase